LFWPSILLLLLHFSSASASFSSLLFSSLLSSLRKLAFRSEALLYSNPRRNWTLNRANEGTNGGAACFFLFLSLSPRLNLLKHERREEEKKNERRKEEDFSELVDQRRRDQASSISS
jgi:hypothetical protein